MTAEDGRLRDGRRIAELLASELDGRPDRGLDRVAVTNADPNVEPTPEGAPAFDVTADGERLGTVLVQPERAVVTMPAAGEAAADTAAEVGLAFEAAPDDPGTSRLVVADGAQVKRAVSVVRVLLES